MRRVIAAVFSILLPVCFAEAIDFTPRYMALDLDGDIVRIPFFENQGKKYGIWLPGGADLAAANGGAFFTFNGLTYASMTWRSSALTPDVPFDAEHLPRYAEVAKQFLPKGSTAAKFEGEEDNVLPMNHWVCHRYTMSYAFYGNPMRDTVTFLNLDDTSQIVIHVSSRHADSEVVGSKAWSIIRSWHELTSAKLAPPVN